MGPGNKLREKGDVEGDVQNASLDRFATIDIDDVRHSLESEERNPYGQRNEGDVEADPPHSIDDPQNERQILGHEKNQDVWPSPPRPRALSHEQTAIRLWIRREPQTS